MRHKGRAAVRGHRPTLLPPDSASAASSPEMSGPQGQDISWLVLPTGSPSGDGRIPPVQRGAMLTGKGTWPEEDWGLGHVT